MIHTESWYQEAVRPIPLDEKAVKKVFDRAWEELLDSLDVREDSARVDLPPWEGIFLGKGVPFKNVRGEKVYIYVGWERGDYKDLEDGFLLNGWASRPDKRGWASVTLEYNPSWTIELVKQYLPEIRRDVWRTLLHEITHTVDLYRKPPGAFLEDKSEDERHTEHYNLDYEVRSNMREIVQEVSEVLSNLLDSPRGLGDKRGRELLKYLLKNSYRWREVGPYLTPENRKKIIQGVWDYVSKYLEGIE